MSRRTALRSLALGFVLAPTACASPDAAPAAGAAPAAQPPVGEIASPDARAAVRAASTSAPTPDPAAARTDRALAEAWRAVVASAPLSPRRMNFFHSSIGIPRMDTATTLPAGASSLRIGSSHARSSKEETKGGVHQDFDGTYHEWLGLEGVWGAADGVELAVRANVAGWDEHEDRFEIRDGSGTGIVRDENPDTPSGATSRHINLSSFGVRAKFRLCEPVEGGWDLAVAPSLQIPFGKSRDLTHAGTYDAALTMLGTFPLEGATLHANLGVTWPLGNQSLFTNEADVDLDPLVHAGFGAAVPLGADWTGLAQVEANSSAFDDVDALDDAPVTLVLGARRMWEDAALEVGVGTSLDWDAGYQLLVDVALVLRF